MFSRLSRSKEYIINIQKGERIHHPQHGVGVVESIGERSFYGAEAATYAELFFKREKLKLTLLKKDLSKCVRSLLTPKQARQLLDHIAEWEGTPKKQWKARADAHQAALDGGDPFEYAKVYKELCHLEANGETFRLADRTHLNQAQELLTEELARCLKKTPDQAQKMLDKAIAD